MFIVWELSPLGHLKVNFAESIRDRKGGASFVIHGPNSRLVVAGGQYSNEPTIPGVELHATWVGVAYVWIVLGVDHIAIEGDSAIVVK